MSNAERRRYIKALRADYRARTGEKISKADARLMAGIVLWYEMGSVPAKI